MKVGEDDDGRKIKIKFKYFADYCRNNKDDSPLYLFESGMDSNGQTAGLLSDYSVPWAYFPGDLFGLASHEYRPPYRWFCIGPERSGTTVHRDPLGTHAWNAVTSGVKRWVLFEPHVPRAVVKGKGLKDKNRDDEAIQYFDYILPRIISHHGSTHRVYECLQEAGDVIFVPGHWWHGVVNLTDAIAVTHNFCGYENFDEVWLRTEKERPVLARKWHRISVNGLVIYLPVLVTYHPIVNIVWPCLRISTN